MVDNLVHPTVEPPLAGPGHAVKPLKKVVDALGLEPRTR